MNDIVKLGKWLAPLFDPNSIQFPHHTIFFYQIRFYKLLVTWSYVWLKLKAQSYVRHTSVAEGRHSGSTESSLLISCFASKDIPPQLSSSKSKEPCIPMCTFDGCMFMNTSWYTGGLHVHHTNVIERMIPALCTVLPLQLYFSAGQAGNLQQPWIYNMSAWGWKAPLISVFACPEWF